MYDNKNLSITKKFNINEFIILRDWVTTSFIEFFSVFLSCKYSDAENARLENARPEISAPNCRAGKCKTGHIREETAKKRDLFQNYSKISMW